MEVVQGNTLLPGDPRLIDHIVCELKSQGIFDQFRKECIADVDTKPAYQNLRQRVEGSVTGFLKTQAWRSDMNKNQLREALRKNIYESGFLETGVERIVDQVVNPKINAVFLPQVEDVVYKFLGLEKPRNIVYRNINGPLNINTIDLLPTDLDPISPDSEVLDKALSKCEKSNETINLDDSKLDDFESPPFEPITDQNVYMQIDDSSNESKISGISGLTSHDSNISDKDLKIPGPDIMNADSQLSKVSSNSRLSIITNESKHTPEKMDISDDSDNSNSSNKNDTINLFSFENKIGENGINIQQEIKDELEAIRLEINGDYKPIEEEKPEIIKEEKEETKDDDKVTIEEAETEPVVEKTEIPEAQPEVKEETCKTKEEPAKSEEPETEKPEAPKTDDSQSKSEQKKTETKEKSDRHRNDSERRRDKYSDKDKKTDKDKKYSSSSKSSSSSSKDKDRYKDKTKDSRSKTKDDKKSNDKESKEPSKTKDKDDKSRSSSSKHSSRDRSRTDSKSESRSSKDHSKKDSKKPEKPEESKSRKSDSAKSKSSEDKSSSSSSRSREHSRSESSSKNSSRDRKSSTHKKDTKDPKKSNKKEKDDHNSSKDKKDNRRSADRDSNDGSSGVGNNASGSKETKDSSSTSSNKSKTSDTSDSNSGSNSGDSGQSDNSQSSQPVPDDQNSPNAQPNPPKIQTIDLIEKNESEIILIQTDLPIKIKKPKFASNIFEARKLMKVRKKLEKLEKKRQKKMQLVQGIQNMDSPSVEDTDSMDSGRLMIMEDDLPESKIDDSKKEEKIKNNSVVSKESWDAIEAKLSQSVNQNVDFDSYVDENNDSSSSLIVEEQPRRSKRLSEDEDCLYFNNQVSPTTERFLKSVETYQKNSNINVENKMAPPVQNVDRPPKRARKSNLKNNQHIDDIEIITTNIKKTNDTPKTIGKRKQLKGKKRKIDNDEAVYADNNNKKMNNCLNVVELAEEFDEVMNPSPSASNTSNGSVESTKRAIGRPKKNKKNNSTHNDSFPLPLSPESDKSGNNVDMKHKMADEKDGTPPVRHTRVSALKSQRYSSDDLYKPRPFVSGSSRRQRGMKNSTDKK